MNRKTKYPKTIIEATDIIKEIQQISLSLDKKQVLQDIMKVLNIKYRGKIAKSDNKTKHYGKFSNKHTVISYHTMVYFIYKKKTDNTVFLEMRKQKNNKEYGYYITMVTDGQLHHIEKQDPIWNKSRDFYNNLIALTPQEHKEIHKRD